MRAVQQPAEQQRPTIVDWGGEFGEMIYHQPLRQCVICAGACTVNIGGWCVHPTCFQYSTAADRGPLEGSINAVALDAESVFAPGTTYRRWPHEVQHLGDLAAIAGPLKLAPHGQIWLLTGALQRLGLDAQPDGVLEHPVVTGAEGDGWAVKAGPHPGWLVLTHARLRPAGVTLVLQPLAAESVTLVMQDDPAPPELVTRLESVLRPITMSQATPGESQPQDAVGEEEAAAETQDQPEVVPGEGEPVREAKASGRRRREIEAAADEIRAAMSWSDDAPGLPKFTPDRAAAAVERWHEVTGCKWAGTHAVIRALLSGHTKWPGTKVPKPADLRLFEELRASSESIWTARSWVLDPAPLAGDSTVVGYDVNMQYVAAAGSIELGEGDPVILAGEDLTEKTLKLPGWVRLAEDVDGAPHGLRLGIDLWLPTPMALYLERDKGLDLAISEALVWPEKRRALGSLAGHFRDWAKELRPDETEAGRDALAMLKAVYTKAFGGYLSSEKGLTPPEWRRPDWGMLIRALAEANGLRAVDKLPVGCIAKAKYADAFYLEQTAEAASLTSKTWPNIDDHQPGKLSLMEPGPAPADRFVDCATADDWRDTYLKATR